MTDGTGHDPSHGAAAISRAAFLRRGVGGTIALAGAGTLLQACGSDDTSKVAQASARPPARPTGSLTAGVFAAVSSLDPARPFNTVAYMVNQNAYEGLTLWNEHPSKLAPALATSWSSNDDATEWTFELRPGVTFHDGEALTSEAVRASFEHHRHGKGSLTGSNLGAYTKIDDSDPQTVVIRYKQPFPDLARNLPSVGIISPRALAGTPDQVAKRLERASAGAGAFRFDAPFRGNSLRLAAFEDYWGDGPYLEQLILRNVPDESARVAALQAGDLDFVLQVSPLPLSRLKRDKRFAVSSVVTWTGNRLNFACDRPPFDNQQARQAIAYCIDQQLLVDKLLLGQAEVARGPMPSGCYGYSEPSLQYARDVEKAKELWDAAGGASRTLTIAYFLTQGQVEARKADAIAEQISSSGIAETKVTGINDAAAGAELFGPRRNYDILLTPFGWINGGPQLYSPGVQSDAQYSRYTGRDILDLQTRQSIAADGPERLALLEELQQLAQERLYMYAYHEIINSDVFAADVHGYTTARNSFMYRFADTFRA
jgi:peptide/nickel transport system substrate-binding protein